MLRQGGKDTPLGPAELTAAAVPLPADGTVALQLTGAPVTARAAQRAELVLTGLTARLRASAEGKADQAVDCGAYAGGETLGSVAVAAAPPDQRAAPLEEPVRPAAGLKVTFDVDAVNTVAKIGADIAIKGELETFLDIFAPPPSPLTGTIKLYDVKNAYLVVFRFMPVHNSINFPPATVKGSTTVDVSQQPWVAKIDTVSDIHLRLYDVRQDGVDLRVGGNCRTAKPMRVPLKGDITLVPGAKSVFKTKADLPAFTGCGTKEDLDPLIGGLVSGPDNPMTVTLTLKCIDTNCAPPR
ncbi:hypothetical protein ACFQV2_15465 [Actinokineospora soli]|uniref:Uncharacterized protein n=1 Tax=Actinokineospora soli TaxID=1048753 RepID=A0ABW2TMJ3_9PSEU